MSGFAAFVAHDPRARPAEALARMTRAMTRPWACGGERSDARAGLALSTREPAADERVWVAFAGRLDDRDRLREELTARGRVLRGDSDEELALGAWGEWREGCAERLLGDFALVVWDSRAKELFAARDIAGVRPFHYHAGRRFFAAASELTALLAFEDVAKTPNEEIVGEYLCARIESHTETLYRSIARLPAAHALRLRDGEVRTWRYWTPRVLVDVGLRGGACDARIRETLDRAVRSRIRGDGPIGVDLSGGLDSSCVAALAASAKGATIETLSLTFPNLACDESPHIDRMEKALGVPNHRVIATLAERELLEERARMHRDFPGHPNGLMADALRAHAARRGIRVELTGCGGDELWSGAPPTATGVRALARAALRELLPRPVLATIARARRSTRAAIPPWLAPDLAARIEERFRAQPDALALRTRAQRETFRAAATAWSSHAFEIEERDSAAYGIELRHPFWDRRMIELALAVPQDELTPRGGEPHKPALRRAMRGVLPDAVRERPDKPHFGRVMTDALERAGGEEALRSMAISRAGWVDARIAHEAYRDVARLSADRSLPFPDEMSERVWQLWMMVGLEIWVTVVM